MNNLYFLRSIFVLALPLAIIGCTKNSDSTPHSPGVKTPAPTTLSRGGATILSHQLDQTLIKNSEGGKVHAVDGDGDVELSIPPGALSSEELVISIARVDDTTRPQKLASNKVHAVYDLGPDGTQFEKDIYVKITYKDNSEAANTLWSFRDTATLLTAEGNKIPFPLKEVQISRNEVGQVVMTGTTTHFSYIAVSFAGAGTSITGGFETVDNTVDITSIKAAVNAPFLLRGKVSLDPNNTANAWNLDALSLQSNLDRFIVSNAGSVLARTKSLTPELPSSANGNTFSQEFELKCTTDGIVNLFLGFDLDVMLSQIDPALGGTSQFKTLTAVTVFCGNTFNNGTVNNNNNNNNSSATPTDIVTCDLSGFNSNSNSNLFNSQPVEGVNYPSCTFPDTSGSQNKIPQNIDTSTVQFDDMLVLLPSNRVADGKLRDIPNPNEPPYTIMSKVAGEPLNLLAAYIDGFARMVLAMNGLPPATGAVVTVNQDKTRYDLVANVTNLNGADYNGTAVTEFIKPATTADALAVKFDINITKKIGGNVEAVFGTLTQLTNLTTIPNTSPPPTPRKLMESMLFVADFSYIKLADIGNNQWETQAYDLRCKATFVNPPLTNDDGSVTILEEYLKVGLSECSSAAIGQNSAHKIVLDVTQQCGGTKWTADCIKVSTMCANGSCPLHDVSPESGRSVHDAVGHFGVDTRPDPLSGMSLFATWENFTLTGAYGRFNTGSYDCVYTGFTSRANWFGVYDPTMIYLCRNDNGWDTLAGELPTEAPILSYGENELNAVDMFYSIYQRAYYTLFE